MNLEGQIASIETANINKETLDALKNASKAMKDIHGGMTIDKVDQTMEELEEQHAISKEIAGALTQSSGANAVDDDELEAEFADMQQEELDNKMLKTGNVPVGDEVHRLPNVAQGERESIVICIWEDFLLIIIQSGAKHRGSKRTTRKKSSGNCRLKWPCRQQSASLGLLLRLKDLQDLHGRYMQGDISIPF